MTTCGLRAEVTVTGSSVCRVVDASATGDVVSVTRSASPTVDDVTVEFTTASDPVSVDASEVFSYDGRTVYRFQRPAETDPACACEVIECNGYPVRHTEVETGTVVLSFVADDIEALRAVIGELEERYDGVSLRCLTRSATADGDTDLVFVDRAELTARQREVLELAYEMGYFDHPKEANATDVAAALGIDRSTFAEHVSAAQSKLLASIIER
jgi:predicted DNA binding protein